MPVTHRCPSISYGKTRAERRGDRVTKTVAFTGCRRDVLRRATATAKTWYGDDGEGGPTVTRCRVPLLRLCRGFLIGGVEASRIIYGGEGGGQKL